MRSLCLGLVRLFAGVWHGLRDPEFRAIAFLLALSAVAGSVFYRAVEGWAWIDAMYFSFMALTTVGDANLAPISVLGKIFTIAFSLIGIGLMLAFVSRLASYRDQARDD
ncbi:MAG: two pore domain potassium channel family protein [Afipia sp.]|nr:two pore domain potassium channel family protein [Afipia sp.]